MSDGMMQVLGDELAGTYTIERELDGGGMSRVFVAEERALGRRVVIKVLADAARTLDPRRFRAEILLSAGLQHPHIVPVHSAGEVNGAPYFVMPFVEGSSLRARLRDGGAMPVGEATRVLRDVATALHYAHGRGIIHRDLKPENVMLSGGSAVVLDFGVAKALADGSGGPRGENLTGVGFAVGTPRYMAPEQIAGDPGLDHRADIYAFGVLAFELLAGETPFNGSPSELLRLHLVQAAPDLGALRPEVPATLAALVSTCLEKDPARRPASAAIVLDALDGLATPLTGTRTAVDRPAVRRPRSRWTEAIVIPVIYVLAAGAMLATLVHLAAEERVRDGIVAAGIIGSLLGLPIALASGLLLRVVVRERAP